MVTSNNSKQSPADLARETFKQLSASRTQPTPDAYAKLYNEIAGITEESGVGIAPAHVGELESMLHKLAKNLTLEEDEYSYIGQRLTVAAERHDWGDYIKGLSYFIEKIFAQINSKNKNINSPADAVEQDSKKTALLKDLLARTLGLALPALLSTAPELAQEAESISLLLKPANTEKEFAEISSKLKNLCFMVEQFPVNATQKEVPTTISLVDTDDTLVPLLTKLLSQTVNMSVGALLQSEPALFDTSEKLASDIKTAKSTTDFQHIETRLKDFCYKISLKGDDASEQLQLLLSLFKLLLENVSLLVGDDDPLRGQIVVIQNLISGEMDHRALLEATRNLKGVVYKQSVLKDDLAQSKVTVKQLMNLFVERLSVFADSTSEYHEKITSYTDQITQTTSPEDVNKMLDNLLTDTLHMQTETQNSHLLMVEAQKEVQTAENKIVDLEKKLVTMSEQVHKDQLTGSFNRRGLDEILAREAARADRRNAQLCLGMLDIDNFKKLNDSYGHSTGDEALVFLVKSIQKSLRVMDVVARYGGEEFVIIMPETPLKDAADTMVRVQRELTKQFFMSGDAKIVITFSAGVAGRHPSEEPDTLIKRADKAMYQAKKEGKNRVVIAPDSFTPVELG